MTVHSYFHHSLGLPAGLFLVFLSCFYFSCHVPGHKISTKAGEIFEIQGLWKTDFHEQKQGTTGICFRGTDTLYFRKTASSETRHLSPAHDFLFAFRNYHHTTFFEYIFFEQKLARLYRDSITVDTVFKYEGQKGLVFPCRGCNAVAKIRFRQSFYLVPHTLDSVLWQSLEFSAFIQHKNEQGHLSIFYPVFGSSAKTGCQFISPAMDSVVQIELHSFLPKEQQINLISGIIFYK